MQWKPIPSFPCYEVSEFGDVRRIAPGIRGGFVGKVMKPYIRADGYAMFILRRDNASFHRKAHQLVAEAFIGAAPFEGAEVCHNDGTRTNHHYSNLRWDSHKGNKADMVAHGTRLTGERHPGRKVNADLVRKIREMHAVGALQREIAKKVGLSQAQVSRIVNAVQWA